MPLFGNMLIQMRPPSEIYSHLHLDRLESAIGYRFQNKNLLIEAMTHVSLRNFNLRDYQRLEYLGDSILQTIISDHLFKVNPWASEGALTQKRAELVQNSTLGEIAQEIGLSAYVYKALKTGQLNSHGSFVESLIGGVYKDAGGLEGWGLVKTKAVIWKLWGFPPESVTPCHEFEKPKLQEFGRPNAESATPCNEFEKPKVWGFAPESATPCHEFEKPKLSGFEKAKSSESATPCHDFEKSKLGGFEKAKAESATPCHDFEKPKLVGFEKAKSTKSATPCNEFEKSKLREFGTAKSPKSATPCHEFEKPKLREFERAKFPKSATPCRRFENPKLRGFEPATSSKSAAPCHEFEKPKLSGFVKATSSKSATPSHDFEKLNHTNMIRRQAPVSKAEGVTVKATPPPVKYEQPPPPQPKVQLEKNPDKKPRKKPRKKTVPKRVSGLLMGSEDEWGRLVVEWD